jgi:hypothetical protein
MKSDNFHKSATKHTFNANRVLLITLILCGVLYMVEINSLSIQGYKQLELSKQVIKLKEEQELYKVANSQMSAVNYLRNNVMVQTMESANFEYLKTDESLVRR